MNYKKMKTNHYKALMAIALFGLPTAIYAQGLAPDEIRTTLDWASNLGVVGLLLAVIGAMGWVIIRLAHLYLAEAKDKDARMDQAHKEMLTLTARMTEVIEDNTRAMDTCRDLQKRS